VKKVNTRPRGETLSYSILTLTDCAGFLVTRVIMMIYHYKTSYGTCRWATIIRVCL